MPKGAGLWAVSCFMFWTKTGLFMEELLWVMFRFR